MILRFGSSALDVSQAVSYEYDKDKKILVIHWGHTTKLEGDDAEKAWNQIHHASRTVRDDDPGK